MSGHDKHEEKFQIRSLNARGKFLTFHREYYRDLGRLLEDVQGYQAQIETALPPDVGESFKSRDYPEASRLVKRRNATMRSIILFSAMTAEATVNYYGVRRFGGAVYAEHFERLTWLPKVKMLLLLGEGVRILRGHPLMDAAERLSRIRADLVHPKVKEVPLEDATTVRQGPNVLNAAVDAIAACDAFLDQFLAYIPAGSGIDPREG